MITATIIASLMIFMICFCVALMLASRQSKPPLISWTILGIGLIYGLAWIVVMLDAFSVSGSLGDDIISRGKDSFLIYNLLVIVLTLSIFFGWFVPGKKLGFAIRKKTTYIFRIPDVYWTLLAWFFFLSAIALRWLYVRAYGGFIAYQDYTRLVRAGVFEISNPWSFLQPFSGYMLIASFLFLARLIDNDLKLSNKIGFILSFLGSLYILYTLSGRVGFVVYVGTFALCWLYMRDMKSWKIIWVAFIGVVGGLLLIYWISVLLDLKPADSVSKFVSNEFSFPFVSFFAHWVYGSNFWSGFIELFTAPVYLLPSSWDIGLIEESSVSNTRLILGGVKGEGQVFGTIPTDLLTLGLMQAHLMGIIIIGVFFGIFIRLLQFFVEGIPYRGLAIILFSYISLRIAFLAVFYANPEHVVTSNFGLISFVLCVWAVRLFAKMRLREI